MRSAPRACWARPATSGLLDLRCHDLREHTTDVHRTRRRRALRRWRRHGDEARADLRQRRGRRSRRGRCSCSGPGGRRFDQAWLATWPAATGSACCADATRASTTGSASTSSTASCRSATSCSAGGEVAACVVIEAVDAAAARRDGQRRRPAERELRRPTRPARGAAVHPAGRRSAAGRCPTCCAAAITPASPAGAGRRPCTARCAAVPT